MVRMSPFRAANDSLRSSLQKHLPVPDRHTHCCSHASRSVYPRAIHGSQLRHIPGSCSCWASCRAASPGPLACFRALQAHCEWVVSGAERAPSSSLRRLETPAASAPLRSDRRRPVSNHFSETFCESLSLGETTLQRDHKEEQFHT